MAALKGMVITSDEGILLMDKTLSDMAGVDVRKVNEVASRKGIATATAKSQVIDFAWNFVISGTGNQGGGHSRKGYPRDSALAIPDAISGITGAKTTGLKEVLKAAFDIAVRHHRAIAGSL